MSTRDRIPRPRLARTDPIRSWARLLGIPSVGDAVASGPSDAPPAADVIGRSVDLGYRVVEEYLRQGRRAAEQLGMRSFGVAPVPGDIQDMGLRMMRYAADFAAVWMQFMGATALAGAARPPAPAASPAASPPPPAATANGTPAPAGNGTRVRVEVASIWPTEVWLDLRPEAARAAVLVQPLRATDPGIPRLDDVAFTNEVDGDPPLLRVRVPPSQPPGIYNGLLIDRDTSRPVGTVSVRVSRD